VDVRETPGGVRIGVRVRPRSRPRIELRDDEVLVSVAAPPSDGRATEEARRALAAALGVPPSAVTLHVGARSRRKVFELAGVRADEAERRLRLACRSHRR
jgi:uncharacterized protein YggU (UPF0235/DUF167 family)